MQSAQGEKGHIWSDFTYHMRKHREWVQAHSEPKTTSLKYSDFVIATVEMSQNVFAMVRVFPENDGSGNTFPNSKEREMAAKKEQNNA